MSASNSNSDELPQILIPEESVIKDKQILPSATKLKLVDPDPRSKINQPTVTKKKIKAKKIQEKTKTINESAEFGRKTILEYVEKLSDKKEIKSKDAGNIKITEEEYMILVYPIKNDTKMVKEIFEALDLKAEFLEIVNENIPFKIIDLEQDSTKFRQLKAKFDNSFRLKSTRSCLESIKMLINPYLAAQYKLKKQQKERHFEKCEETFVYRVILPQQKNKIVLNNFNWREKGTYFDKKALSFRKNASKASNYLENSIHNSRTMILSQVLIGKSFISENIETFEMRVPPKGHDTITNRHEDVFVKYDDSEYYPLYFFQFKGLSEIK